MLKIIFSILMYLSITTNVQSSEVQINDIDETLWPKIKITLELPLTIENLSSYNLELNNGKEKIHPNLVNIKYHDDAHINTLVAIDASRSISKDFVSAIKEGLINYFKHLSKEEQISIITFNDTVQILCGFTSNKTELISTIQKLEIGGKKTELYRSIKSSCDILKNIPGKRSLIIISDGYDEGNNLKIEDIIKHALDSNVNIFTISLPSITKNARDGYKNLNILEEKTNGIYEKSDTPFSLSSVLFTILEKNRRLGTKEHELLFTIPDNYRSSTSISGNLIIKDNDYASTTKINISHTIQTEKKDNYFIDKVKNYKSIIIVFLILILLLIFIFLTKKRTAVSRDYSKKILISPYTIEFNSYGLIFPLQFGQSTLGSDLNNTIVIDEPTVSRKHALLIVTETGCQIEDLNSTNGIYVNDKKIDRATLLRAGDQLYFGRAKAIIKCNIILK